MSYMNREISEEHANKLNRAMGKPEGTVITTGVEETYWRMKKACDRLSVNPDDRLLVGVVMHAGELPEVDPPGILELIRGGFVRRDDALEVLWRKKKTEGRYLSLAEGGRKILAFVAGEERILDPDFVRVLEPVSV